jgi:hypothetical protein
LPSSDKKIRLATPEGPSRHHHYIALAEQPGIEWVGFIVPPWEESLDGKVDALIISCDQHSATRLAIHAAKQRGIPVFHILDGVIDWRTTFENPKFDLDHGGVPLFQPLLADHVFALGQMQKRQFEWMGNSQVHALGFPRFDNIQRKPCRFGPVHARAQILVATANTPWVTAAQKQRVVEEFRGLKAVLRSPGEATFKFRISQELADEVGISPDRTGDSQSVLQDSSAIITTPSTLAIEGMLAGVPTLIFDPFGFPALTPSAWTATSYSSVSNALESLICPTEQQAIYQNFLLEQMVSSEGKSAERIASFIVSTVNGSPRPAVVDQVPFAKISPALGNGKYSTEQLASLVATIPQFERTICDLKFDLQKMCNSHKKPTLRSIVGAIFRYTGLSKI